MKFYISCMTATTDKPRNVHHGRNIKRFREMKSMKQEVLASALGDDWTQKKVSLLEGKEEIENDILEQVAKALEVPVEAIKSFDEEKAINIISNTVNNNDNATGNSLFSYYPTINPIEKWVEALEENKNLYERLLQAERERISLLERLLDQK
jgi:transcriptional regulator with XRE-family HTH domain